MTSLRIFKTFFLIAWLAISLPLSGQYYGGQGDGAIKSSTIQITLNGASINPMGMYRGGFGDGHEKESMTLSLNGANIASLYKGGKNDGSSKLSFLSTLAGADLSHLYQGGFGDGHHKDIFSGILTGELISQLYEGGSGDGHHKDIYSGVLTGELISQLYEGGFGDGHDKEIFSGVLSGELISQLYEGGNGDGHFKDAFVGVLSGEMLSMLYSGGVGDGFSKHMVQYIFDFPGCTFVVNTDDDGFGSLRYAIDCAAPGDTIDFSPLLLQDTIVLTSGHLEVTKDLYVDGITSAELVVDGSQMIRAWNIGTHVATIKGLKVIVGTDPSGGAVKNDGILTLIDIDIYDPNNAASSVIHSSMSGSLTIRGQVRIFEN